MEAVIATGGKQYRVAPGRSSRSSASASPAAPPSSSTTVLLVNRDGQVTVEPKALTGARVTGEVVAEGKAAKVLVVKFKRRKNYRRHRGHRQR